MTTGARPAETKTSAYEVPRHLRTSEEAAAYLNAWLDEGPEDAAGVARASGDIVRARGPVQVASDASLDHGNLCRALSGEGDPSFATVLKVVKALGIRLHARAVPGRD